MLSQVGAGQPLPNREYRCVDPRLRCFGVQQPCREGSNLRLPPFRASTLSRSLQPCCPRKAPNSAAQSLQSSSPRGHLSGVHLPQKLHQVVTQCPLFCLVRKHHHNILHKAKARLSSACQAARRRAGIHCRRNAWSITGSVVRPSRALLGSKAAACRDSWQGPSIVFCWQHHWRQRRRCLLSESFRPPAAPEPDFGRCSLNLGIGAACLAPPW